MALIKTGQDSTRRCASSRPSPPSTMRASGHGRTDHRRLRRPVDGKTIGILGLAFKPNTDDMREAPSLAIIEALHAAGARVKAYDPQSMEQARPLLPDVDFCDDAYVCAERRGGARHRHGMGRVPRLDLARIKSLLVRPVVVDLRNIYRPDDMRRRGFTYISVGRA